MVISRARLGTTLGTALGLSLAGCAYVGGIAPARSSTESIASTNRAAAASISPRGPFSGMVNNFGSIQPSTGPGTQVASLDPMVSGGETVSEMQASPPVVQKGTVLWRRTGDESDLPPTPKVGEELRRLRESLAKVEGSTSQQFGQIEERLASNQQTLAQVKDDQQRTERDLRSQTTEAVANVANMAQESMRSMERVARNTSDRWFATNQQLNQLEGRLQTALADVQKQQAQANDRTQAYTDLSVSKSQLETQLAAVREARQAAMEAELRAKSFTGQQLASRDQILGNLVATTSANQKLTDTRLQSLTENTATQLAATQALQGTQFTALSNQLATGQQLTAAQVEALKAETAAKLEGTEKVQAARLNAVQQMQGMQFAALQQVTDAKLAAVTSKIADERQLTDMQMASLRKVADENRTLASSETLNVAAALRQYADTQLQAAAASNQSTLANLAKATDQSVADLSDQTNRRLALIWQSANQNAEKLAEQKANAVAASLAALQQQTAAQKIEPAEIRAIAEQTVAESTPEFRALALKTMQDSQDYIKTVARAAVSDKDPAMQTALADAARDVITKDDKVVFAIRKAVAEELSGTAAPDGSTSPNVSPAVRLGPDHDRAITSLGETDQLDPNRMRIAQLLAPGTNLPAPDAAQLANLSPAAGQAPQETGVGGQQSWSTPGTSLMRPRNRADWMDIRQYKVVVHEDDQTLENLFSKVLKRAEPFAGPWQVRWKVSDQNREVLTEKFSLDAETNFEEFVSYLAQYVVNDRGVKLTFSLFDNERIIVISD